MAQKLLQWVLSETDKTEPQQKESESKMVTFQTLVELWGPEVADMPSNNAATIGFLCVLEFRKCMFHDHELFFCSGFPTYTKNQIG